MNINVNLNENPSWTRAIFPARNVCQLPGGMSRKMPLYMVEDLNMAGDWIKKGHQFYFMANISEIVLIIPDVIRLTGAEALYHI